MGHPEHRGYTLIELMVVVGIASIVGTTFCSVMYYQVLTYMERLDEVDAHQSARAAFNVVRRFAQEARYGLAQNSNARGTPGIGRCCANAGSGSQGNCTAQDGNNDRMRIVNIVPGVNFVGNSAYGSAGPCNGSSVGSDVTHINIQQTTSLNFASGSLLAIGGNCVDPTFVAGNDVLITGSNAGMANGCSQRFSYTFLESAPSLACPSGYAPGFGFGAASVTDFYVFPDSITPTRTNLLMRTDPRQPMSAGYVVAYNVNQFNVVYQIDTTSPPDRRADAACADPRTSADGGPCNLSDSQGVPLTTQQNYNRIVGLQVTLQVQSNTYRPNLPGSTNGYRTWTYHSIFSLRNNGL